MGKHGKQEQQTHHNCHKASAATAFYPRRRLPVNIGRGGSDQRGAYGGQGISGEYLHGP